MVQLSSDWTLNEDLRLNRVASLDHDRPSAYGIANQLLQAFNSQSSTLPNTEAIPDATVGQVRSPVANKILVPIAELVGINLPPAIVTRRLFDVYVKSVHWFMSVFHEPSLREEMEAALATGACAENKLSVLVLILVVILIATKYAVHDDGVGSDAVIDMQLLHTSLCKAIEEKFLIVLDQDDVGALQVCILLSSYYFYHGRPNRCLAINSAAIRMAQTLKFHRELSWDGISTVEREQRRRVWWALYVLDSYGSITYGTTTIIRGIKWQVNLPQDMDDTSFGCPGFDSFEKLEDGSTRPVTTLSYQRYKFRLYRIAEPIMGSIYFHDGRPIQDLVKQVHDINKQLVEWEERIPAELRPESFCSPHTETPEQSLTRIFRLQAIALQLSYDNIQLVLHRPLLVYNGILSLGTHLSMTIASNSTNAFWESSKETCWNSAQRISCIDEHLAAFKPIQNSYATSFVGMQTFTAGVMLGIFALSKPSSAQAQEAKQSIGRLIKMPRLLGYHTTISEQTGRVLERLLRLILDEELKLLLSDGHAPATSHHYKARNRQAALVPLTRSSGDEEDLNRTSTLPTTNIAPNSKLSNADHLDNLEAANDESIIQPSIEDQEQSSVQYTPGGTGQLARGLLEGRHGANTEEVGTYSAIMETVATNPSLGTYFFDNDFFNELDDMGQGWIWEDCHQFN